MNNSVCPMERNHTLCPDGYVHRQTWAKEMLKTHKQIKCSGCGLYKIWVPKKPKTDALRASNKDEK